MKFRQMSAAAIHDISGIGKCSITIALPILSACGVETAVLPTALLSTHTGGFTDFEYLDLTKEMMPIAEHWKSLDCKFDALYSGFLGSDEQIDIVDKIFDMFASSGSKIIMDPVMGDNGKLYQTYTEHMAKGIAKLCRKADIIVPNMTEVSWILETPYKEGPYEKEYVEDILERLCALGPKQVVITGIYFEDGKLGAACKDKESGKTEFYFHDKFKGFFHGTGDLFASVLTGGLLNGMDIFEASEVATEFTWLAIDETIKHSSDYKFGPKFECILPWLADKMQSYRENHTSI